MGSNNSTPKRFSHFANTPEVKGETRVIRCATMPFDKPLYETLPDGSDTLLKAFEYLLRHKRIIGPHEQNLATRPFAAPVNAFPAGSSDIIVGNHSTRFTGPRRASQRPANGWDFVLPSRPRAAGFALLGYS